VSFGKISFDGLSSGRIRCPFPDPSRQGKGVLIMRSSLAPAALIGIALIAAGVVVLNLFSRTLSH